jgi:hypothetical protein
VIIISVVFDNNAGELQILQNNVMVGASGDENGVDDVSSTSDCIKCALSVWFSLASAFQLSCSTTIWLFWKK